MKADEPMKFYPLDEVLTEEIGPIVTPKRDAFEKKHRLNLLGKASKKSRLQRKNIRLFTSKHT